MKDNYDILMIDLDNGKLVAENTKQFLKRISEFSQKVGIPTQMVYYLPYHSKYNLIVPSPRIGCFRKLLVFVDFRYR
ncbi:MAG: hypothetical protein ACJAUH_000751 [Saprospiraceae bacterium]|jgi:hypothetical protein